LAGRRAAEIAASLGMHVSTVREWHGRFLRGGTAALRHRKPPGRPNRVGAAAVTQAAIRLAEDARHERGWTLARMRAEIRRRGGPAIGSGWLSVQLRRKASRGAAPRHTLKGRQDADAVAASRERLQELRRQAAAGAIDPRFLDEAEARTHPYLAHGWAERGTELRIEAPGQAKRRAMLGAFDPARKLTGQELRQRLCDHYRCPLVEPLAQQAA
jgi:transposase